MIEIPDPPEGFFDAVKKFIQFTIKNAKANGVVVGLSGGVDSSVVLKLCVEALGKEKVFALIMPEDTSNKEDTNDAIEFAKSLGVKYEVINISPILRAIGNSVNVKSHLALINIKPRVRMTILYAYANEHNYLVAGTSNKTELLLGYFTKYGDGASDFLPIGDLYKTQVKKLAKKINIPDKIVNKTPSAGLYPGQTDEGELGLSYEIIDKILYAYELGYPPTEISSILNIKDEEVAKIINMVKKNRHKRRAPYIFKVSLRTPFVDYD